MAFVSDVCGCAREEGGGAAVVVVRGVGDVDGIGSVAGVCIVSGWWHCAWFSHDSLDELHPYSDLERGGKEC